MTLTRPGIGSGRFYLGSESNFSGVICNCSSRYILHVCYFCAQFACPFALNTLSLAPDYILAVAGPVNSVQFRFNNLRSMPRSNTDKKDDRLQTTVHTRQESLADAKVPNRSTAVRI